MGSRTADPAPEPDEERVSPLAGTPEPPEPATGRRTRNPRAIRADVRIVSGPAGRRTTVEVNGEDLSPYVRNLTLRAPIDDVTSLVLEYPAVYAEVRLDGATVEFVRERRSRWDEFWARRRARRSFRRDVRARRRGLRGRRLALERRWSAPVPVEAVVDEEVRRAIGEARHSEHGGP